MKTRITLTIDPKISFKAKTVAREKGTSLSALVEELLASVSGMETPDETIAFSEKWRGKVQLREGNDTRLDKLKSKYALDNE